MIPLHPGIDLVSNHKVIANGKEYRTWIAAFLDNDLKCLPDRDYRILFDKLQSKENVINYFESQRHFINWFWMAKDNKIGVAHLNRQNKIVDFSPICVGEGIRYAPFHTKLLPRTFQIEYRDLEDRGGFYYWSNSPEVVVDVYNPSNTRVPLAPRISNIKTEREIPNLCKLVYIPPVPTELPDISTFSLQEKRWIYRYIRSDLGKAEEQVWGMWRSKVPQSDRRKCEITDKMIDFVSKRYEIPVSLWK